MDADPLYNVKQLFYQGEWARRLELAYTDRRLVQGYVIGFGFA